MSRTLGELFLAAGRRYGDRVAVRGHGEQRTYRQLVERGVRLATGLRAAGLQPGDHVAALLEDRVASFEVYVGCAIGGYPIVHVNDRLTPGEVEHILGDSDAAALLHTDGRSETVAAIDGRHELAVVGTIGDERPEGSLDYERILADGSTRAPERVAGPEDLAILGYTSGTTGFPKGAVVSHRAVTNAAKLVPFAYRLPMYGRCAFTGTLSFVSGIWGVIIPHLYTGGTVDFLYPYTIESWIDHVVEHRSTFTYAPSPLVPGFIDEVARRPEALRSLQSVLHSASPLPRAHAERLGELIGDRFVEVWGMTESVAPVTATVREDYREGSAAEDLYRSVGRPLATASVRVIDERGSSLPPGEPGELAIEADTLFSGYYGQPERTAEVLVDGEYRTGDVGYLDESGYVYITDRIKDMIISGGMNVYPAEIEGALATLDGVAEAAVFGVPHERWGETPAVAVVRCPGSALTEDDVIRHVEERLASYKRPSFVRFLDELPRNASLKIQKHQLRERFEREPGA
jgi:acyl-CoA synthetase (AMP-forming)/AMP-acid ligase II